ncbi:MAG: hypothetical protein ACI9JY_001516 [Saprospiraceae bacterium]|jgi:hypothetical protein
MTKTILKERFKKFAIDIILLERKFLGHKNIMV